MSHVLRVRAGLGVTSPLRLSLSRLLRTWFFLSSRSSLIYILDLHCNPNTINTRPRINLPFISLFESERREIGIMGNSVEISDEDMIVRNGKTFEGDVPTSYRVEQFARSLGTRFITCWSESYQQYISVHEKLLTSASGAFDEIINDDGERDCMGVGPHGTQLELDDVANFKDMQRFIGWLYTRNLKNEKDDHPWLLSDLCHLYDFANTIECRELHNQIIDIVQDSIFLDSVMNLTVLQDKNFYTLVSTDESGLVKLAAVRLYWDLYETKYMSLTEASKLLGGYPSLRIAFLQLEKEIHEKGETVTNPAFR